MHKKGLPISASIKGFLLAAAVWFAFPLPFYTVDEYYTRKYSPMIYEAIHDDDILYNSEHIVSLNVVCLESLEHFPPESDAIDTSVFKRKRKKIGFYQGFELIVLLKTRGWHYNEYRNRTETLAGFDYYRNEKRIYFDEVSGFSEEQNCFDSLPHGRHTDV